MDIFKKINTEKGYSAINIVIGMLVLLLTFSLIVEFTILGSRYSYISQTASYISRTIGMQGGIKTSAPSSYPDDLEYQRSYQFYNILNSGFDNAGFNSWIVRINGRRLTPGTNIEIPEKEKVEINIKAGFKPIFNFRGNSENTVYVEADRTNYSSFTERNDSLKLIK